MPADEQLPLPLGESRGAAEPGAPDDAAWRAVRARWDDDEAHRAYLASFADLDGLAEAGRRYREALAERPGDPVALRWRDEVIRRATASGLAALPRTAPRRPLLRPWQAAVATVLAVLLLWALAHLWGGHR